MSKATGYSLWLVPNTQSELYAELARCINDMAEASGGPAFVPHATLLGGIEGDADAVLNKCARLAQILTPYEIELDELGSNGIYFQILFSRVHQTAPVMRANEHARHEFESQAGYFPHLSLAYGDFAPEKVQELMRDIKSQHPGIIGSKFLVGEIELWSTEGTVQDWRKIQAFPINP
jgi:2'-5' RNA ligase